MEEKRFFDEEGNEFAVCCECGEVIPLDDVTIDKDGNYFCDDCRDNYLYYCERCGEYVYSEDTYEVHVNNRYSEWWCSDCVDDGAIKCDDCGRYYPTDRIEQVRGGDDICDCCLDDNYCYCERCREWVHSDYYNYDQECCDDCAEASQVANYHSHKNKWTRYGDYKAQWRGVWRGIGIELEIDRNDEDLDDENNCIEALREIAGDHLYFEHDGSLDNGFEIITHPHTIEEFYKLRWNEILMACLDNGYTSHDAGTCGLHLHISRAFFGSTSQIQDDRIAKILHFFSTYWNDIVKISRRKENELDRWASKYDTNNKKIAKEIVKKGDYQRYKAVNLTNPNTIEFRIMRGTLNTNSFYACIDFLLTIAKNSKKITWKNINDKTQWLEGIEENTKNYIAQRGAF